MNKPLASEPPVPRDPLPTPRIVELPHVAQSSHSAAVSILCTELPPNASLLWAPQHMRFYTLNLRGTTFKHQESPHFCLHRSPHFHPRNLHFSVPRQARSLQEGTPGSTPSGKQSSPCPTQLGPEEGQGGNSTQRWRQAGTVLLGCRNEAPLGGKG